MTASNASEGLTERRWFPPATVGWLFLAVEERPSVPEDLIPVAIEEGLEPDEVDAVAQIAGLDRINVNPFVRVEPVDDSGFTVEVIIPPDNTELIEVYKRYNS